MTPPDLGIYLHVPFCERVCPYCDFAVVARRRLLPAEEERTVAGLLAELEARAGAYPGHRLATIYLGGGTPSLLRPESIARLIAGIRETFEGAPAETTLEVNPSSVERDRLPGFREAGVDRLSIGIQSFDDACLHRLGRAHRAEEGHRTLEAARAAGFAQLSVDLIFGIPGQDAAGVAADVEAALGHGPGHVSAYALTVEEGTPYATAVAREQLVPPGEEITAAMMETTADALEKAGLLRYEVSSYARAGSEARHNRRYWRRQPVLGLGPGAHSSEVPGPGAPFGARRANERELSLWLTRIAAGRGAAPPGLERLDEPTARAEAAFLALRTREGLARGAFEAEFGLAPEACWPALLEMREAGLLEVAASAWRLTRRGWLLADTVSAALV